MKSGDLCSFLYSPAHRGDDEEEEDDGQESGEPAVDQDHLTVKAEEGEKEPLRKKKSKAPANELPILGEDELRKFRKEELLADVVHLQRKLKPLSKC